MKQIILKALKVFFIFVAILLLVLVTFGFVLSVHWPWWVGIFILLGFVGLAIAVLFFRKLLHRRREQQFVHEIIQQDESQLKALVEKDRVQGKELQDRWKEAIEALKHSHLKKLGNPLYVLPWYLFIGESGSGKTTSIQSARLSSPFAEVSHVSGISGTRNCDWWFFEQAIILDTAGRYTIRVDDERDKQEWQKFLILLTKYRQREPIDGLIVGIAADKLLQATPEAIQEDGLSIRRRVDEMMRVLGAKFPVYVLVTKCDLVQGMTQFCDELPEKSLGQAMGYLNHDFSTDTSAFLEEAFNKMGERLRDLRLLILHHSEAKKTDPALFLFPEEFEKLKSGLDHFMKSAFQVSSYQETPLFRGLFFSSGRQEGTPYSHFLKTLGLIEEKEVLPGTSKGLFLHDFFSKILPKDRGLFTPTKRSLEWGRITKNLGLTSFIVLVLAICGLLCFAAIMNMKVLNSADDEFAKRTEFRGDFLQDMTTLDRFRQAILEVEKVNRNWWIPRFGLNQSTSAEVGLKSYYCKQFQKNFLATFDEQMFSRVAGFSSSTADEPIGRHAYHVVRRINLLKARLAGSGLEELQGKPQPSYDPRASQSEAASTSPQQDLFGFLYLYYLVWQQDSAQLNVEMVTLQRWLDQLLALRNREIHWLVGWANAQPVLSPVTLESFWGGSQPLKDEVRVAPAFTRKGKELIDTFMGEIEAALANPPSFVRPKAELADWYRGEYLRSWNSFAVFFPKGADRLKGREEWQKVAAKMATDEDPFFAMLKRGAAELEPMALDKDLPGWLKLILQFDAVKLQSNVQDTSQEKGIIGKAAEKGKKLIEQVEKSASGMPGVSFDAQIKAVQSYRDYQKALSDIIPVSASRKFAYEITSQVFTQDEATGQSVFFTTRKAEGAIKAAMTSGAPNEDPFWKLLGGPLDFLWVFMRQETACYVQKIWEEEVVAETQEISDPLLAQQRILGENGFAWKFVRSVTGPFIGRNLQKGGYYAKDLKGDALPFETSFLAYLNKGVAASAAASSVAAAEAAAAAAAASAPPPPPPPPKQTNFAVTIRGLPTDANPDAKNKPSATRLELHCDKGSQKLDNFNYPNVATFNWSADACKEVVFKIELPGLVLSKVYEGSMAFPQFLRDFRTGERTFGDKSFPEYRAALESLGVKYITVKYEFTGHRPVIDQLARAQAPPPPEPRRRTIQPPPIIPTPSRIAKCWDR